MKMKQQRRSLWSTFLTLSFLTLMFCFPPGFKAYSSNQSMNGNANLSNTELTVILQKCIDLPSLQKYYPANKDKTLKQLNVMQYPYPIPSSLLLTMAGKAVNYVEGQQLVSMHDPYLSFSSIVNTDNTVTVIANYRYNYSNSIFKMVTVTVEFNKNGTTWDVINSTLTGDTL